MIGELAASGTAVAWGAADFCGGKASRFAKAPVVVVIAQLSSLPLLAIALLLTADGWPGAPDVGWGFLAGLSGGVALVLLYRALAAGTMSVVAPTTAVTAASIPLVVGLFLDQQPRPTALAGAGVAVLAVGLVSMSPGGAQARASVPIITLSLAAGVAFGMYYVLLAPVSPDAELWPLLGVRAGSAVSALALVLPAAASLRVPRRAMVLAVSAGTLDILANAAYLVATYNGTLSVVGPIASLYPAGTVLLAVAIDHERLRPLQSIALALAAAALVLTHLG
jgi:drug/metabolite transporter (DMT)-like permease